MRNDTKSNYVLEVAVHSAAVSGTTNTVLVDHALASSCSFLINVTDVGAAGTVDLITQYSDDDITWIDYPADDEAGNDVSIPQVTVATSNIIFHIPNPRGRYSRVEFTVGGNNVVIDGALVYGALRHVSP